MYVGRSSRTSAGRVIKKLSIQYQVQQQQELKRVDHVDNRLAFGASDPRVLPSLGPCRISQVAGECGSLSSVSVYKSSACRHRLARPASLTLLSALFPFVNNLALIAPPTVSSLPPASSAPSASSPPLLIYPSAVSPSRHGSGCVLSGAFAVLAAHEAHKANRCPNNSPRVPLAPLAACLGRPRPRQSPHGRS
jgi:hypothetical protein